MINFILSHKIIVVIVALLMAVGVWIGLSSSSSTSSNSLLTTESTDSNGPDQGLVATLLALRAVKLDGSIFQDPGFQALTDFSTQIVPEPIGRPNPFAPLGSVVGAETGANITISQTPTTVKGAKK
jgi:hypothetical protein